MRALGLLLVAGSLVLGSGGVAYRSHAGNALGDHEQFGMTSIRSPHGGLDGARAVACPAPAPLEIRLAKRTQRRVVSLTNRGHNYGGGLAELSRPQPPASAQPSASAQPIGR